MLEIWGRRNAVLVVPVLWTVSELGIPHIFHMAGGAFGVIDTPEYRAMNPTGKIPTIKDGDFLLHETHAIIRYLCGKYGDGKLSPSNLNERAVADKWMEWCRTEPFPTAVAIFFGLVRTEPENRDAGFIEQKAEELGKTLAILDQHLAKNKFVTGDDFTMGDIPLGCLVYRYYNFDIERPSFPNLERWYNELKERQPYQEHVMNFFGRNPQEWAAFEKSCNAV